MIGERVRLAREACRLTQVDLAQTAGLPQASLSDLESGRTLNPAPDVVEKIARATTFPVSFFHLGPLPDLPEGHYRKLKRGTVRATRQVRAQVRQIVELAQRAESALKLPAVRIEPVRDIADMDDVERVAEQTRVVLGVGARDPIPNLTRAMERAGVIVVELPNEMEDHEGFSAWPDYGLDGRPIIALTAGRPGDRGRATGAHELGHLLLHALRQGIDPTRAEKEAWRFAGALLLPADAMKEAMKPPVTLRVLMGVKATFGASMGLSAQRALDLRRISREQFISLRKQLSARGWNRVEPVEVTPEKPLLIAKVIDFLAGQGSIRERADRVGMPMFSFRALSSSARSA